MGRRLSLALSRAGSLVLSWKRREELSGRWRASEALRGLNEAVCPLDNIKTNVFGPASDRISFGILHSREKTLSGLCAGDYIVVI
jgi:hypothetical protein